jgi:predicted RNase H-like HicB family nuclease
MARKKINKYNKNNMIDLYPFVVSHEPDDEIYVARSIDLKGCHSQGESYEEAISNLHEAMEGWIEAAHKNNIPVPPPSYARTQAKKFLLRLEPDNVLKLESLAAVRSKSLNALINEAIDLL